MRRQFGVKLGENRRLDFDPQRDFLSFQIPADVCAKFRQNRIKSATARVQTDRQTHMTQVILLTHAMGQTKMPGYEVCHGKVHNDIPRYSINDYNHNVL